MFTDATFQPVRRASTSRSHQFRYGGGGIQEFPDLCHAAADGGLSAVCHSDDAAGDRETADPVEATSAYSHFVLLVEFSSWFLMLMFTYSTLNRLTIMVKENQVSDSHFIHIIPYNLWCCIWVKQRRTVSKYFHSELEGNGSSLDCIQNSDVTASSVWI